MDGGAQVRQPDSSDFRERNGHGRTLRQRLQFPKNSLNQFVVLAASPLV